PSSASGGRIINLTSGQGMVPMPTELAYAATKGGIDALTRSLSAAVASKGITVNAVDPGPTDTGWMSQELREVQLTKAPMGRLGTPQDAARLVAFLASEEAGWSTGKIPRSRGGSQPGSNHIAELGGQRRADRRELWNLAYKAKSPSSQGRVRALARPSLKNSPRRGCIWRSVRGVPPYSPRWRRPFSNAPTCRFSLSLRT